jgi:hypothetical protein
MSRDRSQSQEFTLFLTNQVQNQKLLQSATISLSKIFNPTYVFKRNPTQRIDNSVLCNWKYESFLHIEMVCNVLTSARQYVCSCVGHSSKVTTWKHWPAWIVCENDNGGVLWRRYNWHRGAVRVSMSSKYLTHRFLLLVAMGRDERGSSPILRTL